MFKRMIIFIIFSMLVFSVPAYCDDADTKESSETKQEEKSNSEEEAGSKPDPTSKDDTHVSSSQQSSSSPYVISNLKPQYDRPLNSKYPFIGLTRKSRYSAKSILKLYLRRFKHILWCRMEFRIRLSHPLR